MSTIRLPAIILPEARLRGRQFPDVTIPNVDLRGLAEIDLTQLRRMRLPNVRFPASIRELSASDVHLPDLAMRDVHLPEVRLADLHRPSFDTLPFDRPVLTLPRVDLSRVEIPRVEVRILRNERRGPSAMTIATLLAIGAAAAGWWLLTSPATAPKVRGAARRARRRIEQRWPMLASQADSDDAGMNGTEQFWSQAEGWRPEGGGFEAGPVSEPGPPGTSSHATRNGDPAAMAAMATGSDESSNGEPASAG